MAINDPEWTDGEIKYIKSTGTTVTVYFNYGEVQILHDYSLNFTPKGIFKKPIIGCFGGML
jgi:hypothetical protein